MRPYTPSDRAAWDGFVMATSGSHPAQRTAWLAFIEETSAVRLHAWLVEEDGRLRGILPLFEKRRLGRPAVLFSSPGGLLADDDGPARALLDAAATARADRRAEYVELRDQRRAWPGLATNDEHCTHVLTLAADADTQWHAFDAKLRNQIRKAERAGFTVRWGREHLGDFCRVMLENMRDLGTPIRTEPYFRRALDALGEQAALLVIALGDEPVGAMVLAWDRGVALDLWASSLRRHFAHCPNQLLYWEAIREAIRRGCTGFDFGRSQWDTGAFRFKSQWGAEPVPLYYQYVLAGGTEVPRFDAQRSRFDLAAQLWRRLPLPVARVLGEPIRRRFPELL